MQDLSIRVALDVLDEIEDVLEERKLPDRRQKNDPNNKYSQTAYDRRSGKERRKSR